MTACSCGLDAGASTDVDGTIDEYRWDFGDGTTATGLTAGHTYAQPGSYTVTLTVTDDDGAVATATETVAVTAPNAAPTAAFAISCTGLACAFNGHGSSDDDGTITSYDWDFGDGTTANGASVDHPYAGPGSYTVMLTVSDDDGAAATTTKMVAPITLTAHGYKLNGWQRFPRLDRVQRGRIRHLPQRGEGRHRSRHRLHRQPQQARRRHLRLHGPCRCHLDPLQPGDGHVLTGDQAQPPVLSVRKESSRWDTDSCSPRSRPPCCSAPERNDPNKLNTSTQSDSAETPRFELVSTIAFSNTFGATQHARAVLEQRRDLSCSIPTAPTPGN